MNIGVPLETAEGERRVALSPEGVKEAMALGTTVSVASGAGSAALFSDSQYADAGAKIVPDAQIYTDCDFVLKVSPPSEEEVKRARPGTFLATCLSPSANAGIVKSLCERQVSAFSMDLMPRISRAQSMDVLSSMSTIAGYKASLIAAEQLPRFFPMLMTAAGTLPPARIFVIGAGVAGLQAIATCRRLGAIVEAFDVRPAVKEQIESLGAKFVGVSLLTEEAEDAGGYAKEVSSDTHAKELELIASRLKNVDAVVTTALIPGKPAPVLITKEMLKSMKPGSVIVDLAAPNGGNCEATVKGESVTVEGVRVIGRTDLVTSMASDASRMYSKNMTSFLSILLKEGNMNLDMSDEIVKGTLVTHEGKVVHEVVRLALEKGGS